MKTTIAQVFEIYKLLLLIHIRTKTLCPVFHNEGSKEAYEFAFDVFHKIAEKGEDVGAKIMENEDADDLKMLAYEQVEKLKGMIQNMIGEKNTAGTDNLLRGLIDQAEGVCGNLRAYTHEIVENAD